MGRREMAWVEETARQELLDAERDQRDCVVSKGVMESLLESLVELRALKFEYF
jgi:hypothetical protein